MAKIVAVTSCPTGIAHTFMAAESLQRAAQAMGHTIKVETQGSVGAQNTLTPAEIADADVVLIAADAKVDMSRFTGKPVYETSTSAAIKDGQKVVQNALAQVPTSSAAPAAQTSSAKRIVGITACPTGIAHTFMAAEGLQKGAESLGHQIKVETQGSVGAQNTLTDADIRAADLVIIAADTKVDLSRFRGKPIYETSTNAAINDGQGLVKNAIAQAAAGPVQAVQADQGARATPAKTRRGPYKHLLTGVSYMIPFVVAGGIMIALAFAIGGYQIAFYDFSKPNFMAIIAGTLFTAPLTSLGAALFVVGAKSAFLLFVPVLSAYIAYSIADRPGLAPGMIGGILAGFANTGFLGGLASGFLAGYVVLGLTRAIRLPRNLAGLMPVLILPLFGSLIVGLLMVYVVGTPIALLNQALINGLKGLQGANAAILGLILGLMMAFDMGGPVNKAAYAFATGLLLSQHPLYAPMAAVMAAGMTPPLGIALATALFKDRFTHDEREAGKAAWVLGASFITEGVIPFAAEDPFRVIPSCMVGSAITGALSMLLGAQLRVPHGGIWVMFIPGVVSNLPLYLLSIVIGTVVTTGMLFILRRRNVAAEEEEAAVAAAA